LHIKDLPLLAHTNKYQLVNNVLFQKVDDETVILEPENGNYFTLDPVGTFMIENLQEGKSVEQVIDLMSTKYDVSGEQVSTDLNELVTNMLAQNLIAEANK
jgi:hypothetical protein